MALRAVRNLNGYKIGGRMLRVDNASTEEYRTDNMKQPPSGGRMRDDPGERVEGTGGTGPGPSGRFGGGMGGGGPVGMPGGDPPPPMEDKLPYGEPVDAEHTPETISKAVASLPPTCLS